jgi:hypothetical protein
MTPYRVMSYHTDAGYYTALVGNKGTKLMTVVIIFDSGVAARRVPIYEERYMKPSLYKGKDYPVSRAIRGFKKAAKSLGITKTAKRALMEAAA